MATSVFFGGRRLVQPQAATKIDASALAGVSPAAVGIVALLGTAEGGKPLDASSDNDLTSAGQALERYKSGNLRVACQFCFEPSNDDDVPGGAQKIVPVKVNPATQAALTLQDATAIDALVITSHDWGLFTNQINISIATGTNTGKRVVVDFEDNTETFDDLGGTNVMNVLYTPGTQGYGTALASLTPTTFSVLVTKAVTGLSTERTANIPAPGPVRIVSSSVADVGIPVTIFGIDGSNNPIYQTLLLNGTTQVNGTTNFTKTLGVVKAATTGTITVSDQVIPTTLFTLTNVQLSRGVVILTNSPSAGAITTAAIDTLANVDVLVFGLSPTGALAGQRWNFTSVLSQAGSVDLRTLQYIVLGEVLAARTITLTLNAVSHLHTVYPTVQKLVDRLNSLSGFTANALQGDAAIYLVANLDRVTSQSILTAYGITGTLQAIIDKLNAESAYVTAARAANAGAPPANTVVAQFLTGGGEGTTTITQWQQAFTALQKRRVNVIAVCTEDPAVHSLLMAHLIARAGRLRSEANGYVGLGTAAGAGETKTNIKSQILALNTRHISALVQQLQRYDPDTGLATWYAPWMNAVVAAGCQAGAAVGEPLTHKTPIALDIRNDATWTVEDNADELIDAGAMLLEKIDGEGIRYVRSITTHLRDDNMVFCEMSANAALNHAVYELRRRIEKRIGKKGLAGSASQIKGIASDEAGRLITDEIIVAWRGLFVEQVADVFPVRIELAPVGPINFIPITSHVVAARVAA